ncbi:MAG: hypothetical protein K9W43_11990 [Candidatus Thorarchaeota archaeon]|nr:hypothetical protein [Candidatus Thorarchaeota archaeon]
MAEPRSTIARRIRSTGTQLLSGAQKQVVDYKARFDRLKDVYDSFLSRLLIQYQTDLADVKFVDSFFGKRDLTFAGVDGTIYKYPTFDLIVFFAGAYSSEGTIIVADDGRLEITYRKSRLESGTGISSVLPVYINEVAMIDQTILTRDEEGRIDETLTRSDDWIIDNTAFADYMMGLSEFYLGYKLVTQEHPVDILLMDRILSSEVSSFYAETSPLRIDLDKDCGLIGCKVDGKKFTKTEWSYARRLIGNPGLDTPPARGEFLLPRIISDLLSKGPMTKEEILNNLGLTGPMWERRLDKVLKEAVRARDGVGPVIKRKQDYYHAIPQLRGLLQRIAHLVDDVCERIFSLDESVLYDQRFKIDGRWITTNDLAFLSLMSLYLTMDQCWKNPTLLVGVAKDSSARDLKSQLLPVLNYVGRFRGGFGPHGDVPDTDRMILQWVSLQEFNRLKTPWATCEYDTAFKTIVPHFDRKPGLVSGARRNQVSLNRTFIKAYFQLSQARSDPKLRSNVLLYDRLAYPQYDVGDPQTVVLQHDYNYGPEPLPVIFYEGADNPIQKFIITLFAHMTQASIPEMFGHIRPLFEADKIAKYHYDEQVRVINSTQAWLVARPELREYLFYLGSFRERRSDIEHTRKYS